MKEAMKQITSEIDALPEGLEGYFSDAFADNLAKVREALAQRTEQEPVGEVSGHDWSTGLLYRDLEPGTPLYTTPPQRTWVSLSDETLDDIYFCVEGGVTALETWREQARAIETRLKEKNT
jgi:hypothetical protein